MNPPRFELDHAVRRFFAAHGVTVKKSHIMDRSRPAARETAEAQPALHAAETEPRKRRRRRKKGGE
jgi:hypothetical protein